MKKKITWKMVLIVLLVLLLSLSMFRNYKLKQENELLSKGNNIVLSDCRYCGGTVDLFTVNDSFYIQCRSCKLHTTYFRSKRDLVIYWNKN